MPVSTPISPAVSSKAPICGAGVGQERRRGKEGGREGGVRGEGEGRERERTRREGRAASREAHARASVSARAHLLALHDALRPGLGRLELLAEVRLGAHARHEQSDQGDCEAGAGGREGGARRRWRWWWWWSGWRVSARVGNGRTRGTWGGRGRGRKGGRGECGPVRHAECEEKKAADTLPRSLGHVSSSLRVTQGAVRREYSRFILSSG